MDRPRPEDVAAAAAEAAAFEALKQRLQAFWAEVFPGNDSHYTSVVVPSLAPPPEEMAQWRDAGAYEERLLFLLIRLRNPFARLVYVTSQPIHPLIIEYYLQLLAGITASQAQRRLTLLCVHDSSPRPLTEKLLERPRLLERIRRAVPDPARAYLTVPASTPLERTLAVRLGIPLNAPDPELTALGRKSQARRLLAEAGLEVPLGIEDLRSEADVLAALEELRRRRPGLRAAVLKLDDGIGGAGNAVVRLASPSDLRRSLHALETASGLSAEGYLAALARRGGVAEELVEAPRLATPSVQLRINPRGQVFVTSTHEQMMGGPLGHALRACAFPARASYRLALQEQAAAVGRLLAARGVVGRASVDFMATRADPRSPWRALALEINLRMGATTHPMLALRFLSDGRYDSATGVFLAPDGSPRYYYATDSLRSDSYRRLVPEDLVEVLTLHHLRFDLRSATGVVFHMLGGIAEHGQVGVVAIGRSRAEALRGYSRAAEVLDLETGRR